MGKICYIMADKNYEAKHFQHNKLETAIDRGLRRIIDNKGVSHFITCLCTEFDLMMAEKILELRSAYPDRDIMLWCILHHDTYDCLSQEMRDKLYDIVCQCDKLIFWTEPIMH